MSPLVINSVVPLSGLSISVREKPGVVRVEKIGVSTKDRPILAFHITDPTVPVTRKVLVFAGIHALEWVSTEVAVRFTMNLSVIPQRDTLTVIPLLNPDGRAKVERDLRSGENNVEEKMKETLISIETLQ